MKKADIFKPGWRFTVETFMVKKTKNYWYYDIRCAYLKWGQNVPEVISYEGLHDEWKVKDGLCKIKRTSDREDVDWKQIYEHFRKRFPDNELKFIRF